MSQQHSIAIDAMNSQASPQPAEDDLLLFTNEPCQPFPRKRGEAPFNDSWEAEAYALGNLLVKLGHVSAQEWMDLLAESIWDAQANGDPDTGETYYHHWCRSLEQFCFQAGLSTPGQHRENVLRWRQAILNTPHGVPLTIENAARPPLHQDQHHDSADHGPLHAANAHGEHHGHSHERPAIPPKTYEEPIAIQTLNSSVEPVNGSSVFPS